MKDNSTISTKYSRTIFRGPLLAMLFFSFLLAGCASTATSPHSFPPPDSLIKLQQEVSVSGKKKLYIQDGRVRERAGVVVVEPYCHFTIDRVAADGDGDGNINLKPDTFEVTKAYRVRDLASSENIQYAGRAGSDRTLSTVIELIGGSQPEVTRLTCSRWGMISDDGWPTLNQMRDTLAPLVEIELAG
jgi:hypothetical protein